MGENKVNAEIRLKSEQVSSTLSAEKRLSKGDDPPVDTTPLVEKKVRKRLLLQPLKKVLIDCGLYFLVNAIMIYTMLFIIPDVSIAMVSVTWVAIIAWRGGLPAGLLACFVINASGFVAMHTPPHTAIPMPFYFGGKIPGVFIGFVQALVCGAVVGYISSLVHALRDEIALREQIQADLEQRIAELNAFGHTVAHDLKNPLMVINVSIGALVKEFALNENPKTKKMMSFIQSGTVHMRNIIEALLLFAGIRKIDADKFTSFSVGQCVDEALKRMEYFIEHGQVAISKPPAWPSVFGYAPWITEVWVNYINNAIKYGGNAEKQIAPVIILGYDLPGTFTCEYSDHLRFWVRDNGKGLRSEQAAALFKEFSRVHTSGEGHGIGLSIVKSVVEKLNGTVGVESQEGEGSLFYFTLPLPPAAA